MGKEKRVASKIHNGRRAVFPKGLWEKCGDQFRGLRTRINFAFGNERFKVILVTSAVAEEGKSTVAINLARALSMASRKVLLLDADLRRSRLHTAFGVRREPGLTDFLPTGISPAEKAIQTDVSGLDLLPSGSKVEDPADLLLSEKANVFFEKAHFFYDYVVLDAPPVLPVADAVELSRWSHGVVLVTEYGKTPREVVKEAIDEMKGSEILGVVMNKIPATRNYYNYYGYY